MGDEPTEGKKAASSLSGVDVDLYRVVAQRRLQWDALVWQVPLISLTGLAFLFTIALSANNSEFARVVSSALALTAALASMQLMARHRQAEISDAHWLRDYEEANFGTVIHGQAWQARRDAIRVPGHVRWFKGYWGWMLALGGFAGAALAILVLSLVSPTTF